MHARMATVSPPLDVVEHANMRFLFAVTMSLVKTGIAPTGHVGIVFEVDVVLKDRVRMTLQADVRGAARPLLIEIPISELWRCVMLESELPTHVVPLVGENLVSWIPRQSIDQTAALMHVRRHLVELWLHGKADGLLLRGSPPVVHRPKRSGSGRQSRAACPALGGGVMRAP